MLPRLSLAIAVAGLLSVPCLADDPVSGPKVGEAAPGFEVELATGDKAGEKVDYLKSAKDKPMLVIFWGEVTRPGFGLIKDLDKYGRIRQPEGLEVLIVRLSDDKEKAAQHAKILNEKYDLKSVAGVVAKAGPKDYGISEEAEMTVLLLDKEHKVLHNLARRAPEKQDFDEVRKAIDKLLGPSPVPFP
jgi:hypothetical protein